MRFRPLPLALALAVAVPVALARPVAAQDHSGPNLDAAAAAAPPGGAATLGLAAELYALGLAQGDALTVLTAER